MLGKTNISVIIDKNTFDIDDTTCVSCMNTVYEPVYCAECHAPTCTACRKVLNKNDEEKCMNCQEKHEDASLESEKVKEKKKILHNCMIKCVATIGHKHAKC